jgi:hypothetical protein
LPDVREDVRATLHQSTPLPLESSSYENDEHEGNRSSDNDGDGGLENLQDKIDVNDDEEIAEPEYVDGESLISQPVDADYAVITSSSTKERASPAEKDVDSMEENKRPTTSRKAPAENYDGPRRGEDSSTDSQQDQSDVSSGDPRPIAGGKTINKCDFPWALPDLSDHLACLFDKLEKDALPLVRNILGAHLQGAENDVPSTTEEQSAASQGQDSTAQDSAVQEQIDLIFQKIGEYAGPVTRTILDERLPWLIEAALAKAKEFRGGNTHMEIC